jgi:hypothetical protein
MSEDIEKGELYKLGLKTPGSKYFHDYHAGPFRFEGVDGTKLNFTSYSETLGQEAASPFNRDDLVDAVKYTPEEIQEFVRNARAKVSWIEKTLKKQSRPKCTPPGPSDDETHYAENQNRGLTSENF